MMWRPLWSTLGLWQPAELLAPPIIRHLAHPDLADCVVTAIGQWPTRGQNKKGACRTKLHREHRRRGAWDGAVAVQQVLFPGHSLARARVGCRIIGRKGIGVLFGCPLSTEGLDVI